MVSDKKAAFDTAQAAGMLFTGQHAKAGDPPPTQLAADAPLSVDARAAHATRAFDHALSLQPDARSACLLLKAKCDAVGWLSQQADQKQTPYEVQAQQQRCAVQVEQALPMCSAFDIDLVAIRA